MQQANNINAKCENFEKLCKVYFSSILRSKLLRNSQLVYYKCHSIVNSLLLCLIIIIIHIYDSKKQLVHDHEQTSQQSYQLVYYECHSIVNILLLCFIIIIHTYDSKKNIWCMTTVAQRGISAPGGNSQFGCSPPLPWHKTIKIYI